MQKIFVLYINYLDTPSLYINSKKQKTTRWGGYSV